MEDYPNILNPVLYGYYGVVLTLFVGLLSIEGTLSSSVDGITAKTTKAAVSNFIPIVGKILGDAVDTVLGCAAILKNAVGVVRRNYSGRYLYYSYYQTGSTDHFLPSYNSGMRDYRGRKNSKSTRTNVR